MVSPPSVAVDEFQLICNNVFLYLNIIWSNVNDICIFKIKFCYPDLKRN